jgi:hypothetical protein
VFFHVGECFVIFQRIEHGIVVHPVTIDDGMEFREILLIPVVKEDRTDGIPQAIPGILEIMGIVIALKQGISDCCIGNRDPAEDIFIGFTEYGEIHGDQIFEDFVDHKFIFGLGLGRLLSQSGCLFVGFFGTVIIDFVNNHTTDADFFDSLEIHDIPHDFLSGYFSGQKVEARVSEPQHISPFMGGRFSVSVFVDTIISHRCYRGSYISVLCIHFIFNLKILPEA